MTILTRLAQIGASRWASQLALAAQLAMLGLGLLLPVYSDEIVWRFHQRAWLDGGVDVWLNDSCGANTIAAAPWFMMPARWFSARVNLALPEPIFVRIEGVAGAALWASLLWRLIDRIEPRAEARNASRTLALALLGMGVMPFLMVMSRPEQALILTVTAIVWLGLPRVGSRAEATSTQAWLRCAAILALATVALSYHLKGVLYAVVAAACLANCARGPRTLAPRLVGLAALAAVTFAAAAYWAGRFACPGDPLLAQRFAGQNLAALIAVNGEVGPLLSRQMLGAIPLSYVIPTVPSPDPISSWLPPGLVPTDVAAGFRTVQLALWAGALGLALAALARLLARYRLAAFGDARATLALAILVCLAGWGFTQVSRNMYEAAHVLPLLVVAIALLLGRQPVGGASPAKPLPALAAVGLGAALVSQGIVAAAVLPALIATARGPSYPPAQPLSVNAFGYARARHDIARAMRDAGFPAGRRLNRPVIDDLTYLPLQSSRLPLHALGVFGPWRGSIDDPARYLARRGSDGVVVDCRTLPDAMRAVAHRAGEVCAVGPAGLARLSGGNARPR